MVDAGDQEAKLDTVGVEGGLKPRWDGMTSRQCSTWDDGKRRMRRKLAMRDGRHNRHHLELFAHHLLLRRRKQFERKCLVFLEALAFIFRTALLQGSVVSGWPRVKKKSPMPDLQSLFGLRCCRNGCDSAPCKGPMGEVGGLEVSVDKAMCRPVDPTGQARRRPWIMDLASLPDVNVSTLF